MARGWKRQLEAVLRQIPGYDPWHQAAAAGAWLDHEAAAAAINWFPENLKHVEGRSRGEPFELRAWQGAIVGNLFGWKRRDDKGRIVRRYRRSFCKIGRGNGKTPLAAGIVSLAFFEDGEPGAQCYLAAGKKEQASILFRNARGMVEQNPALLSRVTIYGGDAHRSLVLKDDPYSFCKVIPADAAGQHGGIPHVTVVDEVHAQKNRDLIDVFETAMAKDARLQPLLVMITTADFDRVSICNEIDDYAHAVRDNGGDPAKPGLDPTFLPVLYELTPDDDWKDETLWPKANPNLGVSVSVDGLRALRNKAVEQPTFENAFRRLHLNQKTKQDFKLISTQHWAECAARTPAAVTVTGLLGRTCFGGLDLASSDDLASLTLAFPLENDWLGVLSFSWCPAERVERRARQKFPYDVWARSRYAGAPDELPNFLTPTEGEWIDYDVIERDVLRMTQLFDLRQLGYDAHGATQIVQNLMANGLDVVPVAQTFGNLAGPTKDLVRRVGKRRVAHFGNPVLAWAVGNAAAHFDGVLPAGGRIEEHLDKVPVMLSKRKSTDKIDPAAALVLAIARMAQHPDDGGGAGDGTVITVF